VPDEDRRAIELMRVAIVIYAPGTRHDGRATSVYVHAAHRIEHHRLTVEDQLTREVIYLRGTDRVSRAGQHIFEHYFPEDDERFAG
jgi:hypothetical protein